MSRVRSLLEDLSGILIFPFCGEVDHSTAQEPTRMVGMLPSRQMLTCRSASVRYSADNKLHNSPQILHSGHYYLSPRSDLTPERLIRRLINGNLSDAQPTRSGTATMGCVVGTSAYSGRYTGEQLRKASASEMIVSDLKCLSLCLFLVGIS